MKWPLVPLADVCRPRQWPTISRTQMTPAGYPVFGANGQIGWYDDYNHDRETVLITCRGATCGTINVCPPKSYVTGNAMALDDLDTHRVDIRFLVRALTPEILRKAITGSAQPQITRESLRGVLLRLPPLNEQHRIAAILDQADALREKRSQVIIQLDGLAQATYRDIFGGGEWPQKPIELLGRISTGKTPPTSEPGMFDGPIPFVTPGDLNSQSEIVRSVSMAGAQASRVVRKGATLVCCIGATIGKVDQARVASAFNQQINVVEWYDEIDDAYGLETVRGLKSVIVAAGASTTMPLLPKSRFGKLSIAVAPVSLQRVFASRIAHLTEQRAVVKRALELDDQLFSSVQARAFRGEL